MLPRLLRSGRSPWEFDIDKERDGNLPDVDTGLDILLRPDVLRQRFYRRGREMDAKTLDAHHVFQLEFGRRRRHRFPHRRPRTRLEQVVANRCTYRTIRHL